jgi:hypothetical protein
VIRAASLHNLTISSNGGLGGNQLIDNGTESEGPGGGGGGGFIALSGALNKTSATAKGALGGTTTSAAAAGFPSNGATAGNDGVSDADAIGLPFCAVPPDTTIAKAEPNPSASVTAHFELVSNVDGASFECRLDGAPFVPCPPKLTTGTLTPGNHTFEARAVDDLGLQDPTPATYTWTVDTSAPDTTILVAEDDPSFDSIGNFELGSDDPTASFECSLDGEPFVACPASFDTSPLQNGAHVLAVRAIDEAGNVDPTPAMSSWTIQAADRDADGLADDMELTIGTDADDPDSDDDGVSDGLEPNLQQDTDSDGLINALDCDSDDDGLSDGTELGLPCNARGTNTKLGRCTADADAGATQTSPLDPDTDGGGVPDGIEDENHDGRTGRLETNPNDPTDDRSPVAGAAGAPVGVEPAAGAAGTEPGVVVLGGGGCSFRGAPGAGRKDLLLLVALLVTLARRRKPLGNGAIFAPARAAVSAAIWRRPRCRTR